MTDTLPPDEREAFELRLIQDEIFSQAIEAEEFDLIEDYAAGLLPRDERRQIERKIKKSPELQDRVLISRQLHRSNQEMRKGSPTWSWWIAGMATACLLLLVVSLTYHHASPVPDATHSAIVLPLAPSTKTDTILLAAERQRDNVASKPTAVYKVHSSSSVRLQIMLPAATRQSVYSMRLASDHGNAGAAIHLASIKPQGAFDAPYLEVVLPAGSLRSALYLLKLNSRAGNYDLTFRVETE